MSFGGFGRLQVFCLLPLGSWPIKMAWEEITAPILYPAPLNSMPAEPELEPRVGVTLTTVLFYTSWNNFLNLNIKTCLQLFYNKECKGVGTKAKKNRSNITKCLALAKFNNPTMNLKRPLWPRKAVYYRA